MINTSRVSAAFLFTSCRCRSSHGNLSRRIKTETQSHASDPSTLLRVIYITLIQVYGASHALLLAIFSHSSHSLDKLGVATSHMIGDTSRVILSFKHYMLPLLFLNCTELPSYCLPHLLASRMAGHLWPIQPPLLLRLPPI